MLVKRVKVDNFWTRKESFVVENCTIWTNDRGLFNRGDNELNIQAELLHWNITGYKLESIKGDVMSFVGYNGVDKVWVYIWP